MSRTRGGNLVFTHSLRKLPVLLPLIGVRHISIITNPLICIHIGPALVLPTAVIYLGFDLFWARSVIRVLLLRCLGCFALVGDIFSLHIQNGIHLLGLLASFGLVLTFL